MRRTGVLAMRGRDLGRASTLRLRGGGRRPFAIVAVVEDDEISVLLFKLVVLVVLGSDRLRKMEVAEDVVWEEWQLRSLSWTNSLNMKKKNK
jgi:hypothetical protein